MPFDRIFPDQTALDVAQGNNEFAYGELYLVEEGLRACFAIGSSEIKWLYGADDSPTFANVSAQYIAAEHLKAPS